MIFLRNNWLNQINTVSVVFTSDLYFLARKFYIFVAYDPLF